MVSQTQMDFDSLVKTDPNFAPAKQLALRTSLGLELPNVKALLERSKFVSLGGFCGVSSALESIGLRGSAGPFDWVRSSAEGIIHCFEGGFKDFLTFSSTRMEQGHKVFESTQWSGSFWHHDIEQPSVRDQFSRRIERLIGAEQLLHPAPRFFVRVANSTEELALAPKLLATLQRTFSAAPVYLLVITDMQKQVRNMQVAGTSSHLLFSCVHENLWFDSPLDVPTQMTRASETYAQCIAAAIHIWAAQGVNAPMPGDAVEKGSVNPAMMNSYNGGDPEKLCYTPQGQPPGYLCVPAGAPPGTLLASTGFGRDLKIRVPEGAKEGHMLELRLINDEVSVRLVPDNAVAAAMALMGMTTATAAATSTTTTTEAVGAGLATDISLESVTEISI